jgi:hypothetical protein
MVDTFHWSLNEIDQTDIESLIPFVFHYPYWKMKQGSGPTGTKKVYADQADWL